MAEGRSQLDYIAEDDPFPQSPRRTLSRKGSDRVDTPQTVVLDAKIDRERQNAFHDRGTGVALTMNVDGFNSRTTDKGRNRIPRDNAGNEFPIREDDEEIAMPQPMSTLVPQLASPARSPLVDNRASANSLPDGRQLNSQRGQAPMNKMPEFFSYTVFQIVLNNPTIAHQLLAFSRSRLGAENIEFLTQVTKYHVLLHEVVKAISDVQSNFFLDGAPSKLDLPEHLRMNVNRETKAAFNKTIPALESIFDSAQDDLERLVYADIYPRFVRHQMTLSAARALGSDRSQYGGLGDCFVLTDPTKADNPIVYASDGFVKVTGYKREEIIPRNCRFLQGQQTDRMACKRLKAAIEEREESVELLLNHKKTGEPFWNLLYVTPLKDSRGKVIFFLRGQINCSTTIHNSSDVLRILAQSKDAEGQPPASRESTAPPAKTPWTRSILNAFRGNSRSNAPQREPGMEKELVNRMEDLPLSTQMSAFYTAYSNFIVVNYSSFLISFVSSGIIDMLFPIKVKNAEQIPAVGSEIFKFLTNHSPSTLSGESKSAVKDALKAGRAISLDVKLCAKPSMGFEKFLMHWTPLKDEKGAVSWIIVTLGSAKP